MEGYICPNKPCKEELHFATVAGIRIFTKVGRKKVYGAYCPTCDEHMVVNEYNKKQ
jgi:hypothetical protein